MDTSVFLAKSLSIYLILMGLAIILNVTNIKTVTNEIIKSPALTFISALLALFIGIIMVLMNNIWEPNWRILITFIAWMSLLKGIILLLFPQRLSTLALKANTNNLNYYIGALITLFLGFLLFACGFILN